MSELTLAKTVTLNNGVKIPQLGFGTFKIPDDQVTDAVRAALDAGYRHIDTAAFYANERGVGEAVRQSDLGRDEVFVTSKIWNDDLKADRVPEAIDESMQRLDLEYIDLLLIHWPVGGKFIDAWRHFEQAYEKQRVRAIGVSNFLPQHLQQLMDETAIVPAANQVECHPRLQVPEIRNWCAEHAIAVEAWSPIMQGKVVELDALQMIAEAHGKSPAQVTLRWQLQLGIITIPKTDKPHRMAENADLFDFTLSDAEMEQIAALDRNERLGPDPANFGF